MLEGHSKFETGGEEAQNVRNRYAGMVLAIKKLKPSSTMIVAAGVQPDQE